MESDRVRKRRKELAEALRKGEKERQEYRTEEFPDREASKPICKPKHIIDDFYYATDSLGEKYMIYFINKMSNSQMYYAKEKGIVVPPEDHRSTLLQIQIDDETTDSLFQILKHSILFLDVSEVKRKFKNINNLED